MISVTIFKKFVLPKISKDAKYNNLLPVISILLAFATAIAAWIQNPSLDLVDLLITSLGAAVVASGSYEHIDSVLKMVSGSKGSPLPIVSTDIPGAPGIIASSEDVVPEKKVIQ
jgi:hypothetical protein